MFKGKRKDAFEIRLKKETRKELVKYILPIMVSVFVIYLLILFMAGNFTCSGAVAFLKMNKTKMIPVTIAYLLLIPFIWFMEKPKATNRVSERMLKRQSKSLVEKMMLPNEPVKVNLFKVRNLTYGNSILELRDKADFYAVLGEKDNLISTYFILNGDDKKIKLEFISKEEFTDYYQFVDDMN